MNASKPSWEQNEFQCSSTILYRTTVSQGEWNLKKCENLHLKHRKNSSPSGTTTAVPLSSKVDLPVKPWSPQTLCSSIEPTQNEVGHNLLIKEQRNITRISGCNWNSCTTSKSKSKSPSESTGRLEGLKISWFPVKSIFSQVIFYGKNNKILN
jgi:hypothetical protein